jgi:predicted transcriptional regulator
LPCPSDRKLRNSWFPHEKEGAIFVHDVMSTGVVTAKKTDTARSIVIQMINRQCEVIPVVEGVHQYV